MRFSSRIGMKEQRIKSFILKFERVAIPSNPPCWRTNENSSSRRERERNKILQNTKLLLAPLRANPDECVHSFIHVPHSCYPRVGTRLCSGTMRESVKDLILAQGKRERWKIASNGRRCGKGWGEGGGGEGGEKREDTEA